jgi:hypothetical protein
VERCELCSAALPVEHAHLVEPGRRGLVCACEACAILFGHRGALKYRRVRREVDFLADFHLTDIDWAGLSLPVELAFFLHSTSAGRVVAVYPSPGGATEALFPLETWHNMVVANPSLQKLEPDIEALLANRVGTSREYYRVGVDECYRLVGLLRTHWQGFSGGTVLWDEVGRYFTNLKTRAYPVGGSVHA